MPLIPIDSTPTITDGLIPNALKSEPAWEIWAEILRKVEAYGTKNLDAMQNDFPHSEGWTVEAQDNYGLEYPRRLAKVLDSSISDNDPRISVLGGYLAQIRGTNKVVSWLKSVIPAQYLTGDDSIIFGDDTITTGHDVVISIPLTSSAGGVNAEFNQWVTELTTILNEYLLGICSTVYQGYILKSHVDLYVATGSSMFTVSYLSTVEDTNTPPSISLIGGDIVIMLHTPYFELGYSANDLDDGDLTALVNISSNLDTSQSGTYLITYTVTDSNGGTDTKIRTLTVNANENPTLALLGASSLTVNFGETYNDLGAVANDLEDGDISANIQVTGVVDTNQVGVYPTVYAVTDSMGGSFSLIRTVTVVDVSAPVITLIGDATLSLPYNSVYLELGAVVTDAEDTGVTYSVTGNVNTSIAGTYTLTYTATDSSNKTTTETRTVIVNPNKAPVLTRIGGEVHPLLIGGNTPYVDYGYNAVDFEDGDIQQSVVVTGTIDQNNLGDYLLTYTVTDNAGATSIATRTVRVTALPYPNLVLNGGDVILTVGTAYVEQGYTANDLIDGNVSANILESGSVDPNTLGVYVITYWVGNTNSNTTTVHRTVTVVPA